MTSVDQASWALLEAQRPTLGNLEARRILQGLDYYMAVGHDGARHLLLGVPTEQDWVSDERSRGLLVKGRQLVVEGQPLRPFIDLTCTDRNGHDAFDMVANEILQRLTEGSTPTQAVTRTLERWRRFWGNALKGALSDEALLGLFGELWFLSVWLLPSTIKTVEYWAGPTGARHDFQFPSQSVEVKATLSTRGHIHHIHGVDQLEAPENGPLYLFSLRARQEAGSSNSLVSLIRRIEGQLSGAPKARDIFETRLAQSNYSPAHDDYYDQRRFRIVEERLYWVDAEFPRIRTQSFVSGVPAGIESISYVINLETCANLCIARSPSERLIFL
ncbi:MAG TPA: PD-(D/E)XK motif protein [Symbiobacteriaceae bacterium]|nr:PD-(D/E)XK motif protein [Symbiobacteriaceae bacterium]